MKKNVICNNKMDHQSLMFCISKTMSLLLSDYHPNFILHLLIQLIVIQPHLTWGWRNMWSGTSEWLETSLLLTTTSYSCCISVIKEMKYCLSIGHRCFPQLYLPVKACIKYDHEPQDPAAPVPWLTQSWLLSILYWLYNSICSQCFESSSELKPWLKHLCTMLVSFSKGYWSVHSSW